MTSVIVIFIAIQLDSPGWTMKDDAEQKTTPTGSRRDEELSPNIADVDSGWRTPTCVNAPAAVLEPSWELVPAI
jgi:hypothetical protein